MLNKFKYKLVRLLLGKKITTEILVSLRITEEEYKNRYNNPGHKGYKSNILKSALNDNLDLQKAFKKSLSIININEKKGNKLGLEKDLKEDSSHSSFLREGRWINNKTNINYLVLRFKWEKDKEGEKSYIVRTMDTINNATINFNDISNTYFLEHNKDNIVQFCTNHTFIPSIEFPIHNQLIGKI